MAQRHLSLKTRKGNRIAALNIFMHCEKPMVVIMNPCWHLPTLKAVDR